MKWYFNIRQSHHSVLVEIRPTEDTDSGYIAAFKQIEFESREVLPATVKIGVSLQGYGDLGMPLDKSYRLIEWLDLATWLATHLDHYITTPADFKKRFEAVQYNPEAWQSSYVFPAKEEPLYQQKPVEEWREGRREE